MYVVLPFRAAYATLLPSLVKTLAQASQGTAADVTLIISPVSMMTFSEEEWDMLPQLKVRAVVLCEGQMLPGADEMRACAWVGATG